MTTVDDAAPISIGFVVCTFVAHPESESEEAQPVEAMTKSVLADVLQSRASVLLAAHAVIYIVIV